LSALGLGLLISTISNTQQEAVMTSFLFIMPLMLLSGFMFPVSSMPVTFQWLTLLNPLRHFLEIVRAVFLKGAGLDALWPQFLALLVMGAGVLGFATTSPPTPGHEIRNRPTDPSPGGAWLPREVIAV
jgi:ABC-2 type transport system permease protein